MKRILFLTTLMLAVMGVKAQFALTSNGFVSTDDETKNYTVIDVPDTPKNELFQKTQMYLNTMYNNPKFVTAVVENEQIVIDAYDGETIRVIFVMNGPNIWQYSYKYTFRFRDNRIQFTPFFKSLENTQNASSIDLVGANVMGTVSGIFNKKGKCLKDKAKESIEESVNKYVTDLVNALTQEESLDDW